MPLDKETRDILKEQAEIAQFVKGDGWGIVKRRLQNYLDQFNFENIEIDGKDADEVLSDIKVAKRVLALFKIFVEDIEGDAVRYETNKRTFDKDKNDYLIIDSEN